MRQHPWLAALVALPLLAVAGQAHATDSQACGSQPAGSNIPGGAQFFSRASGPVKGAIDGVGEYRTHSGIAHGNGWYTHSTMFEPSKRDWADGETSCGLAGDYCCQGPLKGAELQNGYPGSSQINGGALYKFYYQPGSNLEAFFYQRSDTTANNGMAIANWLWSSSNFAWVGSRQDGSQGFYRVGFNGVTPYAQYGLYQYRDMQGINAGGVPWDYGDVCSTTIAYAQHMTGKGDVNNNRGEGTNLYNHGRVANGVNSLYNAVYNECSSGTGFWTGVGAFLSCLGESDLCDDAARQVANCMSDGIEGHCYDDSDTWVAIRDQAWKNGPKDGAGMSTAVSVSPDNISGWGGWGFGSNAPYGVNSWDSNNAVQWNSGGSVYGCWF
jgi:hypothetical protein